MSNINIKETLYPPPIHNTLEDNILEYLIAEIENNTDEYFKCQEDKRKAYNNQKE